MKNDNILRKIMNHTLKMRRLTNIELINTYWQQAHEIVATGRLAFVIRGNASWESERPEGLKNNGLWLKSNRYDPIHKHIAENPVQTYLQWYMNIYEIWGTLDIELDPDDADASKPLIKQALEKATNVTNVMSLLYGVSLQWYPARYTRVRNIPSSLPPEKEETEIWDCILLPRSQDEQISTVLKDEHITQYVFPLLHKLEAMPTAVGTVIKTATSWHAQANRYASGLNRFLNYWASIELLGNFFYARLPADVVERKSEEDKKGGILSLLNGVTTDNCIDAVRQCDEIREPTARTRILAYLGLVADRQEMETVLFERDTKTGTSLYQIRNDIAHGNLSEHDFEQVSLLGNRQIDAHRISKEIIITSIERAEDLSRLLNKEKIV